MLFFKKNTLRDVYSAFEWRFGNFFSPQVKTFAVILIDRKLYRHLFFFV